jgi:PAS domain S-box-containing protein
MMNYQDKTKDELIEELQKLQLDYDSLKSSYENEITERKKVEEALKFTRLILNNAADTMTCIGYDGHFIDVNDAFCRSVGYSREQLLSMTVHDIDPLYPAETWSVFWEKLKQAGSLTFESRHRTKDGKLISVEVVVNFFEHNGKEYHSGFARDITERKRAEEQLQESKKKFQSLVETTNDFIWEIDLNGIYTYCSPQIEKLWGLKPEEMLGKSPFDLLPPEDREQVIKSFSASSQSQSSFMNMEIRSFDSSRQVKFLEITGVPFFDHESNIGGYRGISRDITERKQLEEFLHMEKENFRHSLDDSPLGVRIVTMEGNTIYANQAIINIYGYDSLGELQKTPLKDRYTPESYVEAQERKRQRESGDLSATDYEISIVRKNGEIRHLQVYRNEVLWNDIKQFQVIYKDITERKLAEEMLRKSELKYRNLIEQAPDIIFIVDAKGNLLHVNKTGQKMLGYSEDELCKMKTVDTYPTDEMTISRHRLIEMDKIREGGIMHFERLMRRKDGSLFPVEISVGALKDGNAHAIIRDITERKQAEEEIRKSKKLLEDLHKHLNEILENERALISREIHDQIGQSLTALKLDLNWMNKYINTNPEAAAKLKGMIELVSNTIKDVQRISSDLRPGILDDLGLVSAIEWYCDEFEKRTGIKCILKLDSADYGDSQINLSFFRVLQETLTNVIRHANASSVTIKLHHTQKGTTLDIMDNGIGITREKVESAKSLGLIGMRERVREFGGKVGISSRKGQGTKLTIYIPMKKKSV